jgi:hypothetical protein
MMMTQKTNWKWLAALPVAALTLGLGGCGGGGDDDGPDGGEQTAASITACFTVDRTVNFAMISSNIPTGAVGMDRSTAGPMAYNGQAVTGQRFFYPIGTPPASDANYWTVTSSGVTFIATVSADGSVLLGGLVYPQDMRPDQPISTPDNNDIHTFIGFETVNLANNTFSNVCHFKVTTRQNRTLDGWYAPGYGLIKQVINPGNIIGQYNGNL